ncbi:MAG: aminomethyl-transferring glycine dehydrogenase subunit GcvPB, partial [Anaerolineaceae bacterium]
PVGVVDYLIDYLPGPIVVMVEEGDEENPPYFDLQMPAKSIGRVKSFWGHFGVMIRAFTYISMHGAEGLRKISQMAVLNANYILALIKDKYHLPYDRICMHEFVVEGQWKDAPGVHALDVAKRLMDYDFHPPTNYFPLIVPEALMIEPTETESKQTMDAFAEALNKIADEAKTDPDLLHNAPHHAPIRRLDEVKAARDLVMCCYLPEQE